jgi:hypothetical protein
MDAVSEILDDRARATDKVTKMVVVSLMLHAAIIAGSRSHRAVRAMTWT